MKDNPYLNTTPYSASPNVTGTAKERYILQQLRDAQAGLPVSSPSNSIYAQDPTFSQNASILALYQMLNGVRKEQPAPSVQQAPGGLYPDRNPYWQQPTASAPVVAETEAEVQAAEAAMYPPSMKKPKKAKPAPVDTPNGTPMDGVWASTKEKPVAQPSTPYGSIDEHMAAIMSGRAAMPKGLEGLQQGLLGDGTGVAAAYDQVRNALAPMYNQKMTTGLLGF